MTFSEVISAYISLIIVIAVSSTIITFTALTYIHSQQEVLKNSIWLATWQIAPDKVLVKNIGSIDIAVRAIITTRGDAIEMHKEIHRGQTVLIQSSEPIAGIKACIPRTHICTYVRTAYTQTRIVPSSPRLETRKKEKMQQHTREKKRNSHSTAERKSHPSVTVIHLGRETEGQKRSENSHTQIRLSSGKRRETSVSMKESTSVHREAKRRANRSVTRASKTRKSTRVSKPNNAPTTPVLPPRYIYFDFEVRESPVQLARSINREREHTKPERASRYTGLIANPARNTQPLHVSSNVIRNVIICRVIPLTEWRRNKEKLEKEGYWLEGFS